VSANTLTVAGNFTVAAGTVTHSGGTIAVTAGAVSISGTLNESGGTFLSKADLTVNSGGTVNVSGTGVLHMAQDMVTTPSNAITIAAGGTIAQSGGSVDVKVFTTTAGAPNGTYTQSAGTFKEYSDFANYGTFTSTGGTVDFVAAGGGNSFPATLGPTQFFNVINDVDPKYANQAVSFSVAGNWTSNAAVDMSGKAVTVTFNGSGAQTIGGTASTTFYNATINKPSGTATLAQTEIIKNGNLTVTAGTLDLAAFTMDRAASGGTLTVSAGATLKIGGTNTFPANYATHTLAATSTVEYSGTAQTVTAESYGNLTLSGSGTKTMPGSALALAGNFTMSGTASATAAAALTVNGNFTLGSGTTFAAASFSHQVKGNFSNSGTFTAGTSTFTFTGTSPQSIGGSNATTFNALAINNAAGVSLSGVDATVGAALTLTSGLVTTGANTLVIGASGTVSRTSGYVVGNLRKPVATGAPTVTFEVGDAGNYTPVSVTFASVTVAGALTARTTAGDHPSIATSLVNAAKSVNRYWTLTNSGVAFTNCSATFTFVPGDVDAGASTATFIVGRYVAGAWSYPTVGTITGTTTQATGLTAFGDFQIGEPLSPALNLSAAVNPSGTQPPGTDLGYTISFSNTGGAPAAGLVIIDSLKANVDFKVGSATSNLGTTGLTAVVAYSNNGGATFTYTPVSAGGGAPAGYDRNVTHVRWTFTGNLSQTPPNNAASVGLTARIR
jgi:uncharacterized repeat protein (TIGR01451 family)